MIWVWCGVAEELFTCLLTNRLHGKAAELCLANSRSNRVTTTRHMSTLIASTARDTFYHMVLVKIYCDFITIRRLQLINTSINTFFSKLRAF